MSIFELKYLILAIIGIDVALIIISAYMIRKIRLMPKTDVFGPSVKIFESLLRDADNASRLFQEQIQRKHDLIDDLSTQLDKRIDSLTVLLQRADMTLLNARGGLSAPAGFNESLRQRRMKIITLADKGCKPEDIANRLSIPQGEVKLVIDLTNKSKRSYSERVK